MSSSSPSSSIDDRLVQFLKEGKDWDKKATNIPGVFLLKIPAYRGSSASIAIEINPLSSSGSPTKKRGVIIRSGSELEEINRLLSNPKLVQLATSIDEVNPEKKTFTKSGTEDVFEV
ncbi:MAG TPA: hypothetical protein VIP70_10575 [Nitrososphaeraceae archaeon]|jgi:glycerophosphoryl diester phosphodiesterase